MMKRFFHVRFAGSDLQWLMGALLLVLSVLPLRAQDTNAFVPDGGYAPDGGLESMRYMVSNALAQFGEMMSTNAPGSNDMEQADYADTNAPADTNFSTEGQGRSIPRESRSQWLDRQRTRQASAAASAQARDTGQSGPAVPHDYAPARPDYSAFRLVNDRNIFDPNRVPHLVARSRTRERTARVESFSLVGTMSYEKGTFAFFDGTSSDYKKALKLNDTIAGYKITTITPEAVALASGTNQVQLAVGKQLRSEEGGAWFLAGNSQAYPDAAASSNSVASASASQSAGTASPSGGDQNDVIKRMMQRREQE